MGLGDDGSDHNLRGMRSFSSSTSVRDYGSLGSRALKRRSVSMGEFRDTNILRMGSLSVTDESVRSDVAEDLGDEAEDGAGVNEVAQREAAAYAAATLADICADLVVCHICEKSIPAVLFEEHTRVCSDVHRAEMDVVLVNDALKDAKSQCAERIKILETDLAEGAELATATAAAAAVVIAAVGGTSTATEADAESSTSRTPRGTLQRNNNSNSDGAIVPAGPTDQPKQKMYSRYIKKLLDLMRGVSEVLDEAIVLPMPKYISDDEDDQTDVPDECPPSSASTGSAHGHPFGVTSPAAPPSAVSPGLHPTRIATSPAVAAIRRTSLSSTGAWSSSPSVGTPQQAIANAIADSTSISKSDGGTLHIASGRLSGGPSSRRGSAASATSVRLNRLSSWSAPDRAEFYPPGMTYGAAAAAIASTVTAVKALMSPATLSLPGAVPGSFGGASILGSIGSRPVSPTQGQLVPGSQPGSFPPELEYLGRPESPMMHGYLIGTPPFPAPMSVPGTPTSLSFGVGPMSPAGASTSAAAAVAAAAVVDTALVGLGLGLYELASSIEQLIKSKCDNITRMRDCARAFREAAQGEDKVRVEIEFRQAKTKEGEAAQSRDVPGEIVEDQSAVKQGEASEKDGAAKRTTDIHAMSASTASLLSSYSASSLKSSTSSLTPTQTPTRGPTPAADEVFLAQFNEAPALAQSGSRPVTPSRQTSYGLEDEFRIPKREASLQPLVPKRDASLRGRPEGYNASKFSGVLMEKTGGSHGSIYPGVLLEKSESFKKKEPLPPSRQPIPPPRFATPPPPPLDDIVSRGGHSQRRATAPVLPFAQTYAQVASASASASTGGLAKQGSRREPKKPHGSSKTKDKQKDKDHKDNNVRGFFASIANAISGSATLFRRSSNPSLSKDCRF
ncbi:hypothetical protein BJ742DRAFT_469719 [Cladochytrium replicatum]|nr:hypothetical protein BJ742DRAFT_469719 [Cladochytrium replicatum]